MGRMYSVIMDSIAATGAKDLLRLSAAATDVVIIHEVHVSQSSDAGDAEAEQIAIQCQRSSTDGTGTSATPEKLGGVSDAAFNGTAVTNLSADTTITGAPLRKTSEAVSNGVHWQWTPEAWIIVPPSGRFVVRLDIAPADSLTVDLEVVFEEIG